MKKTVYTAAIILLAIGAQAQKKSEQPKAQQAEQAAPAPARNAAEPQEVKAYNDPAQPGTIQQETVMPDGTAVPATTGEQQPARSTKARQTSGVNVSSENAAGQKPKAQPVNKGTKQAAAPQANEAQAQPRAVNASENSAVKSGKKDARSAKAEKKSRKAAKKESKKANQSN